MSAIKKGAAWLMLSAAASVSSAQDAPDVFWIIDSSANSSHQDPQSHAGRGEAFSWGVSSGGALGASWTGSVSGGQFSGSYNCFISIHPTDRRFAGAGSNPVWIYIKGPAGTRFRATRRDTGTLRVFGQGDQSLPTESFWCYPIDRALTQNMADPPIIVDVNRTYSAEGALTGTPEVFPEYPGVLYYKVDLGTGTAKNKTSGGCDIQAFGNVIREAEGHIISTISVTRLPEREKCPGDPPGDDSRQQIMCKDSLVVTNSLACANTKATKRDPVYTRGYPLTTNITFNTQAVESDRPMGNATFSWDVHLDLDDPSNHYLVVDGDGTRLDYGPDNQSPVNPPGAYGMLQTFTSGTVRYRLIGAGPPEDIKSAGNFAYDFDIDGRLLEIRDPSGNRQTVEYVLSAIVLTDVSTGKSVVLNREGGLVTHIDHNGGAESILTYDNGRLTSVAVKLPNGPVDTRVDVAYSAAGLIESITQDNDPESAVNFTYTIVDTPHGPLPLAHWSTSESNYTIQYYQPTGSQGTFRTIVTNHKGGQELYDFDVNEDLVRIELPQHFGAPSPTVYTLQHDANHNRTFVSNGITSVTMLYSSLGKLVRIEDGGGTFLGATYTGADLLTVFDNSGSLGSYSYSNPLLPHTPTAQSDGQNDTWGFAHNPFGQVLQVDQPAGSPEGATVVEYHDAPGEAKHGYVKMVTDGGLNTISMDAYSLLGDLQAVTTKPNFSTTNTSVYAYDGAQRVTRMTHPDGKRVLWNWNGRNLESVEDEAGTTTQFSYCPPCGKLEDVNGPLGFHIGLDYDGDMDLKEFTDPRNFKTYFDYGLARELKKIRFPDNTKLDFLWDEAGRVRQAANGRNQTTGIEYDAGNRLKKLNFGPSTETDVVIDRFSDGLVQKITHSLGFDAYEYWPDRLVKKITYDWRTGGLTKVQTLEFAYFGDDKLQSLTWKSDGAVVSAWVYAYDPSGRLFKVTRGSDWSEYYYDGEDKLTRQLNSNGTETLYDYYQPRGWITKIEHKQSGNTFARFTLEYDSGANTVGNLTKVTELDGSVVNYGYDALYRLTSEARTGTNPFSRSYGYDISGNLTDVNGGAVATFDGANKFASIVGGAFSYDADGNLGSIGGPGLTPMSMQWDSRSKLTWASNNRTSATYKYDGQGKRVFRETPPYERAEAEPMSLGPKARIALKAEKRFYIFAGDLLLGEILADGTVKSSYTWGADGLASTSVPSQGTRWFHYGPQGEARSLTNSSGATTDSYIYSAFGVPLSQTGSSVNPSRYGGKYGYYADEKSKLTLCTYRWYSPEQTKWLSRDPGGHEGGHNLYAYANDSPVKYQDREGRKPTVGIVVGTGMTLAFPIGGGTVGIELIKYPDGMCQFFGYFGGAVGFGIDSPLLPYGGITEGVQDESDYSGWTHAITLSGGISVTHSHNVSNGSARSNTVGPGPDSIGAFTAMPYYLPIGGKFCCSSSGRPSLPSGSSPKFWGRHY